MTAEKSIALPSREISYNYCVAMFVAQQFEDGLRYLLDSGEYYGVIDEIELTPREKKKFKDSAALLDSAASGRLIVALKSRINLPEKHWGTIEAAVKDRNFLAHRFLLQFDYDKLSATKEREIVHVIHLIFLRLRAAVLIVRALRRSLDAKTDEIDAHLDELLEGIGMAPKMPRKKTQR